MKIGIDLDDVTVECAKHFLQIHKDRTGINVGIDEINTYNLWIPLQIEKEEAIQIFKDFEDYGFHDNPEFIFNAKESINKLSQFSDLFFVTARPEWIKEKTINFVNKHFSNKGVYFSGDFHKEQTKSKADICLELELDLMIEDQAGIAEDCSKRGIRVFLFDKPWNQELNDSLHENVTRVSSWEDILEKINLLEIKNE